VVELSVAEIVAETLFSSPTVTVRDTRCQGTCKHESPEECTRSTQLVFPYRGIYVRHVGQEQAVAEANQVLFFNEYQGYRVSHPIAGGDASLTLVISEPQLHELARRELLDAGAGVIFRPMRLRIDARTQSLVALLRHSLRQHIAEPLEAESLALTLVQRALGPRTTTPATGGSRQARARERSCTTLDAG
jgi:AraC family transcriptional regulator